MSDEYMCPFCVTPWKCNGPHIEPEDMAEFKAYSRSQYDLGFLDGLDAARKAVRNECFHDDDSEWCIFVAAIDALREKKP